MERAECGVPFLLEKALEKGEVFGERENRLDANDCTDCIVVRRRECCSAVPASFFAFAAAASVCRLPSRPAVSVSVSVPVPVPVVAVVVSATFPFFTGVFGSASLDVSASR